MTVPRDIAVKNHLDRSREVFERVANDRNFIVTLVAISDQIARAIKMNNKVLIAGNGGSAADAQHFAAEFLSRFEIDRTPISAIALTTDSSVLTAIGNDYGFEHIFERQIRGLGRPGDVFIAISTSGRSPNVIAALKAAREIGMSTVGFCKAAATLMHPLCDFILAVPVEEAALIQQVHIAAVHAICRLIELDLSAAPKQG